MQAQSGCDERTRGQVKRAILERASWRGTERLWGISRHTIAAWIAGWAEQLPPLETTLAAAQQQSAPGYFTPAQYDLHRYRVGIRGD